MRGLRNGVVVGLAVAALAVTVAEAKAPDRGRLTEREIHRVLGGLPYRFHFRDVDFTGNGAVVAGSAHDGELTSWFRVVSGHPDYEGRLLPKRPESFETGIGGRNRHPNDLFIRITFAKGTVPMSDDIITALCEFRIRKPCEGP